MLDLGQRAKLATAVTRASEFQLNYVFLEPKVDATEVAPLEKRRLAEQRSEYIADFLVAAGVKRALIESSMTYALAPAAHPPDHIANRSTDVSIFVINTPGIERCLRGK